MPSSCLPPLARLLSLGFGGVLCLSAVALRKGFSDLGTAFGFLYQILTVTFLAFNWAAQPTQGLKARGLVHGARERRHRL